MKSRGFADGCWVFYVFYGGIEFLCVVFMIILLWMVPAFLHNDWITSFEGFGWRFVCFRAFLKRYMIRLKGFSLCGFSFTYIETMLLFYFIINTLLRGIRFSGIH